MSFDKPIPVNSISKAEILTSRTYAIDWENGEIRGFVDGQEAVRQYVLKALITPRFRCLIYDSDYGSEIRDRIISKNVTQDYLEKEMPFLIGDAITHDERIKKIYNISFKRGSSLKNKDSILVKFDMDTIYGIINVEEVI